MAALLPSCSTRFEAEQTMMVDGGDRDSSPACGGGGDREEPEEETKLEDLPGDVLALVLRRLDGASLAALGCASSAFRALAADPLPWRHLCLAAWPSAAAAAFPSSSGGSQSHHRALFADAFPFPSSSPAPAAASPSKIPQRLVSAVDLRHRGALIMSRAVETDATSAWFLGSPFRVDALQQEGFTAAGAISAADLSLTWLLIDPSTGRAVDASSRRPVAVDRSWLTGETVARFALVFPASGGAAVAVEAAVACDDRLGHVREVSLTAEDGDGGGGVSGRRALELLAAAMAAPRRRFAGGGVEAAAAEARTRYGELVRGRSARKEWKARREALVDLCCSGVGAAAFLGFVLMLTLR